MKEKDELDKQLSKRIKADLEALFPGVDMDTATIVPELSGELANAPDLWGGIALFLNHYRDPTGLELAIKEGDLKKVQIELKRTKKELQRFPLHLAAEFAHLDIIEYLSKEGFKAEEKNASGYTVFDYIITRGLSEKTCSAAKCLLLNSQKLSGDTYELNNFFSYSIECGDVSLSKLLLKNGLKGPGFLNKAIQHGAIEIVKYMLQNGFKMDEESLFFAATSGSIPLLEFLLNKGEKLNVQTKYLRRAAQRGHIEMLDYLLRHYIPHADEEGKSWKQWVLRDAYDYGHLKLVDHLLKNGIGGVTETDDFGEPFVHYAAGRSSENFEFLINYHKVDINYRDKEGRSVLMKTVSRGGYACFDSVILLLKKGVLINEDDFDKLLKEIGNKYDYFALSIAKNEKDMRGRCNGPAWMLSKIAGAIRLLNLAKLVPSKEFLENTLDGLQGGINGREFETGNTALHVSILHEREFVLEKLLDYKADVLIKNNANESAVMLLKKMYSEKNPYLYAKGLKVALEQIEKSVPQEKAISSNAVLLKKTREETKESKESKEQKEVCDEVEIHFKEYLTELESCCEKLEIDQKQEILTYMQKIRKMNPITLVLEDKPQNSSSKLNLS